MPPPSIFGDGLPTASPAELHPPDQACPNPTTNPEDDDLGLQTPAEILSAKQSMTLYPKITNKLEELQHHLSLLLPPPPPGPLPFTGTVKLHGTHADILIPPSTILGSQNLVYQSRNRASLTRESDNLGFAAFCSKRETAIRLLGERVRKRWRSLHPSAPVGKENEGVLVLAGEWIGKGVQRDIAISQLERCFVICSLRLLPAKDKVAGSGDTGEGDTGDASAAVWEHIQQYHDLELPTQRIYNISRSGFHHLTYSPTDQGETFLARAKALTLDVGTCCPFAKALGVTGAGEGLVWIPAPDSPLPNRANFWLKTKAEQFLSAASLPKPAQIPATDQLARAQAFAAKHCTKERLQQAWDYLGRMEEDLNKKGLPLFLSWLQYDIGQEEKMEFRELGLKERMWGREVVRIGKAEWERMFGWWKMRIGEMPVWLAGREGEGM
ncbi:hypothetical protein LTR78_009669 [Recurvomyces mirabilis]|uniref:RNA ligase domain-containing protein n=1 Tax=Recurvomyces mirabilis TaxID=574656 RepID=A0AAE0TP58_9PEZI|nr:hypothetical protein LTR78_009669 [Recurvomyces mirabilis]KAK5150289.1 hypothetical protein LTS14_010266 [Recurvomyces mirabilis]